uniref:Uncharacterized protein n=1 Tax=Opuntia streptacantha TaxID=393608 RepID=A0A7C9DM08_OPUST
MPIKSKHPLILAAPELNVMPLFFFLLTKLPWSLTRKSAATTKRCRFVFQKIILYLTAAASSTRKTADPLAETAAVAFSQFSPRVASKLPMRSVNFWWPW